jgi:hypothetical protein
MNPSEWLHGVDVQAMLGAIREGVSQRKLRLFACGCCRAVWSLIPDARNRNAVEVAEQFADGIIDAAELAEANKVSYGVYANTGSPEPGHPDPATGLSRSGWEVAQAATLAAMSYAGDDDANFGARVVAQQAREAAVYAAVEGHPRGPIANYAKRVAEEATRAAQSHLAREVFGNPFRPTGLAPEWRTAAVVALARGIYLERAFDRLPILADALQDAGCEDAELLAHCRGPGPHVRGCWVVDLVLSKV